MNLDHVNKVESYSGQDILINKALGLIKDLGKYFFIIPHNWRDQEFGLNVKFGNIYGETLSFKISYNGEKIVEEEIRENDKLVLLRSELIEDNVPIFGEAWNGYGEESIWNTYMEQENIHDYNYLFYLLRYSSHGLKLSRLIEWNVINATSNPFNDLITKEESFQSLYPSLFENINQEEIIKWYNKIIPPLGFPDHEFKMNNGIKINGYDFEFSQLGSGEQRLMFLVPILEAYKRNSCSLLYIPNINESLHPILFHAFLDLCLPKNVLGTGTLIYSSTI
jgi:hypothetical protein